MKMRTERLKRFLEAGIIVGLMVILCQYGKMLDDRFAETAQTEEKLRTEELVQEKELCPEKTDAKVEEGESVGEGAQKTESIAEQNERNFYDAATEQGSGQAEAMVFYESVCNDNIFRDGTRTLTALVIDDLDKNGQKDMVVMVQEGEFFLYGEGYIYFYMNEEEAYCFEDEEYPFFADIHVVSGDFDGDGNTEIAFESRGTGNGGAGDWYVRILKYKNHRIEKMEFPYEREIYAYDEERINSINIEIIQEVQKNTYSAYCSYLDETIEFESENILEPKNRRAVGGSSRGYFDLCSVRYEGRDALVVSEYLYGEGGHVHCVGLAKFLMIWDKDGIGHIEKWWIESEEGVWEVPELTRSEQEEKNSTGHWSGYQKGEYDVYEDQYSLIETEEGEYEITLYDQEDNVVYTEVWPILPWVSEKTNNILQIIIPHVYPPCSYYYDKERAKVSPYYADYIYLRDDYIAYMEDEQTLVLTDIFEDGKLYMEIERNFSDSRQIGGMCFSINDAALITVDRQDALALEYFEGEERKLVSEIILIGDEDGDSL